MNSLTRIKKHFMGDKIEVFINCKGEKVVTAILRRSAIQQILRYKILRMDTYVLTITPIIWMKGLCAHFQMVTHFIKQWPHLKD